MAQTLHISVVLEYLALSGSPKSGPTAIIPSTISSTTQTIPNDRPVLPHCSLTGVTLSCRSSVTLTHLDHGSNISPNCAGEASPRYIAMSRTLSDFDFSFQYSLIIPQKARSQSRLLSTATLRSSHQHLLHLLLHQPTRPRRPLQLLCHLFLEAKLIAPTKSTKCLPPWTTLATTSALSTPCKLNNLSAPASTSRTLSLLLPHMPSMLGSYMAHSAHH